MPASSGNAKKPPGEHEPVQAAAIVWIAYVSAVCGCIFAVVLKGLFGISIAAGSSIISDTAILLSTPEKDQVRGFNELTLILVTIFAGLGSFFSCALLTKKANGGVALLKMPFPTLESWTLRHQLHVTVCMCCLLASHLIVVNEVDGSVFALDRRRRSAYLRAVVAKQPAYVFSVLLLSFTMAAVSTLLTLHSALMMRGGNFTSQVFDFFAGLGFAARAKDCRYLWKSHMLLWSIAGFAAGCCIGANAYEDTLQLYSVTAPIMMLLPLWLYGTALLLLHCKRSPRSGGAGLGIKEQLITQPENVTSEPDVSPQVNAGAKIPGEYEVLDTRQFLWIIYVCFVAGNVNAISRQGVFRRPSTHLTGIVARLAMSFQYPPDLSARRGAGTYSAEEYALAVVAFGLGGFVTGFSLTSAPKESVDGRRYPAKMNFPASHHWRPCHQLILTLCVTCFLAANAVFEHASGGNKNFISSKIVVDISTNQNVPFLLAWLLNIFASGLLNGLLCTGANITLRAGNMDGHVLDVFMGLADAVTSRSLRFIWRVRAQMFALVSFFCGCCTGSLVFQSSFGASALSFGSIALAPLWLTGAVLLALRHRASKALVSRPSDLAAAYVDTARGGRSQLDASSARPSLSHASLHRDKLPAVLAAVELSESRDGASQLSASHSAASGDDTVFQEI